MAEQVTVCMFKATRQSNRFRNNQKVWVRDLYSNHMNVRAKWRGRGRYVNATMSRHADENTSLGELKFIEVSKDFANKHELQTFTVAEVVDQTHGKETVPSPRLSPCGTFYICDPCGNEWTSQTDPGCKRCAVIWDKLEAREARKQ